MYHRHSMRAIARGEGAIEGVEGVELSNVGSVGSVVEKGDVEGEDGGGVTGANGGSGKGVECTREHWRAARVGVEARKGGDDVGVRGGRYGRR